MRTATLQRETAETAISCTLVLEGTGKHSISTGCGFLDHMLQLFARHGNFDITLACKGDTEVDYHHTVEDVGIVLGRAFSQALGNRAGILRYGSFLLPMDEALVMTALDISGRAYLGFGLAFATEKIGDFDTQLVQEFFTAFARELGATLHFKQFDGSNSHHIAEAAFKGCARALAGAVAINAAAPNEIPSTKGTIL
ncbi:MAG: imidazoleglycerol-phosphate dehydratase HisB [Oscillospiraceae bacterium]